MAFVFEKIDSAQMDVLLEKIKPSTIMSMSAIQVIDRDRDAVLICLGGRGELPPSMGEPPNFYALCWQNNNINFQCHEKWSQVGNKMNFEVLMPSLNVPKTLQEQEAEVKHLIQDAMICYFSDSTNWLGEVILDYPIINYY